MKAPNVIRQNENVRVVVRTASELRDDGLNDKGKYVGGKWGGMYLRAPDIFFRILEKAGDKLVPLPQVAKVETYLNTGGADGFFFVKDVGGDERVRKIHNVSTKAQGLTFELERQYLRPFIKSPSDVLQIRIDPNKTQWRLVVLPLEPNDLTERAKVYLHWGESVGFHQRSGCRRRTPWWKLPKQATHPAPLLFFRAYDDRLFVAWNPERVAYTRAYGLWVSIDERLAAALLNTTLLSLQRELVGRTNLGQGALDFQGVDTLHIGVPIPSSLSKRQKDTLINAFVRLSNVQVRNAFEELGFSLCRENLCHHPEHPYEHVHPEELTLEQIQKASPDRFELDQVVFDMLGLTDEERLEVYRAVVQLVKERLTKAQSNTNGN